MPSFKMREPLLIALAGFALVASCTITGDTTDAGAAPTLNLDAGSASTGPAEDSTLCQKHSPPLPPPPSPAAMTPPSLTVGLMPPPAPLPTVMATTTPTSTTA